MIHTEAHKCAILPSYQVSLWRHFKIGNLISVTFMLTNENLVSTKGINNSLTWSDHEAKVCGLRYIRQKVGGKHNSWQAFAADSTHTREPETHTRSHAHTGTNQPAPLISPSPFPECSVSWPMSHVDWWPRVARWSIVMSYVCAATGSMVNSHWGKLQNQKGKPTG